MFIQTREISIPVDNENMEAAVLSPATKVPGVLFIHGWGGSQQRDLARAKGIAGLGCVCLTFDLRGHEKSLVKRSSVTREHNLTDIIVAYDQLVSHPSVDKDSIAVIGTSYGGYLATFLSSMRPVRWLALRVPAIYWDEEWSTPKQLLDRQKLMTYRNRFLGPQDNRALAACAEFTGDVLLVESEFDDFVPHALMMSYRSSFIKAHSLTHRIINGSDHALSGETCQKAYTAILTGWFSEMVIGARTGEYPHYAAPHV